MGFSVFGGFYIFLESNKTFCFFETELLKHASRGRHEHPLTTHEAQRQVHASHT